MPYSLRALSIEQLGRIVLARDPRAAVDHDHFVGAVLRDEPRADHRLEGRRRPADLFLAEIDFDVGRAKRRDERATPPTTSRASSLPPTCARVTSRTSYGGASPPDENALRPAPARCRRTPSPRPFGGTASGCPRNISSSVSPRGDDAGERDRSFRARLRPSSTRLTARRPPSSYQISP